MKLPKFSTRKKLRATAAHRSLRASGQAGYEEMSEPNMKLSRALLIVLLLHVVAVSGIIAFNAMKTWQAPIVPTSAPITKTPVADVGSTIKPAAVSSRPPLAQKDSVPTKPIAKGAGRVKQTGNAKRFKVSYDDLVALNHIDDPRKLQIGQKLLIPKMPRTKKANE